jgi:acyl-CoA reductase-like NAD-dependent aldehyde dehydrogenase
MITKPLLPSYEKLTSFPLSSSNPIHHFEVHNPATGETITTIQGSSAAEVEVAVQIAQKAYLKWRWVPPRERSRLLFATADRLESHAEELAQLLSLENGKPVSQAREGDVPFLISVFRYFASLVDKLPHELYDNGGIYSQVIHEPYGVVVGILPFNWPPIHVGGKSAPAIAAGNTIIIKPGEQAPLTVMRIVEIIQEVLPEGVIQAIPAAGIEVPQALVVHKDVKKVSFTGSTRGGAAVSKLAADTITPLSLELGGKNALIVFDDADVDHVVGCAIDGSFFNQGEACTAASRLLVQRGVHDEFVEKLAAAVRRLKVGHGADGDTHVGPLITKAHQEKVEEYIRIGVAEGATIKAQAPKPTDAELANGFYVQPTLFTNVSKEMRIAKEEIFGPVVTVIPFDSYDEAISITNDSDYGLVCAIFSRDQTKAMKAAREIDVGMCFINNYSRLALGTPFGGAKNSGYGREHCIQTLREYSRPKNMFVPSGVGPVPGWRMVPALMQQDS